MKKSEVAIVSKQFALRIIKLCKYLLDNYKNDTIIPILVKQMLRSGTSIAANVAEARNAQSTDDFIHKHNIALKEADETQLWIELLHESDYLDDVQFKSIYDDANKITAMLINLIRTTRENNK